MSLSQLITTVDISNNNIGIGSIAAENSANVVILGEGQNIGIGIDAPLTGVHIGNAGNTIPALYLMDATDTTLPTIAAGDGVFSTVNGVATFTNAGGSELMFTLSSNNVNSSTLVAGTVTVTSSIVVPSSKIILTRTNTTGAIDTVGTLSVIAGTGSFTVNSSVATDIGNFDYLILNV